MQNPKNVENGSEANPFARLIKWFDQWLTDLVNRGEEDHRNKDLR